MDTQGFPTTVTTQVRQAINTNPGSILLPVRRELDRCFAGFSSGNALIVLRQHQVNK
jgi:hypothetical protein